MMLARKWFRFRLRGLFVTVTLIAVWLGWTVNEVNLRRCASATVIEAGGRISYRYPSREERRRDRWLELLWGGDYLVRAQKVQLISSAESLPKYNDHLWRALGALRSLESLSANGLPMGGKGMSRLTGLEDLRILNLLGARIRDDDLRHLRKMRRLRNLLLAFNRITDAGLLHLEGLASLERLNLYRTEITDESIPTLARLKHLKHVSLNATGVTEDGANRLRRLLPHCHVALVTEARRQGHTNGFPE